MRLAVIGWMVVHSVWLWTAITGLTALAAGLVRERRAALRYAVVSAGLAVMVLSAVTTLATAAGAERPGLRARLLYAFDGALMLPEITPRGHTILRIAAMVWIAGVIVGAIRVLFGLQRARRLRRAGLIDPGPHLLAAFAALRDELGIRRAVDLHCSDRAAVPMVLGWRQPRILLPASSAATLTAADVAMFHHPAARWLSRQIRSEREYSCDDIAVAAADAIVYARALARLEDARNDCRFAVAAASGTLLDRIQRILDQPRRTLNARRGGLICAIAAIASIGLVSLAINIPPPSVPAGVRMRRPMPASATPAASGFKPDATSARPRSR